MAAGVQFVCALAEELLLACGVGGLRALSLHTGQLAAHEFTARVPHTSRARTRHEPVWLVAFGVHADMLLLLVRAPIHRTPLIRVPRHE